MKSKTNSQVAFKYGLISFALLFLCVLAANMTIHYSSELSSMIIGVIILGFGISAMFGLSYTLMGLREPNTFKKILAIIINMGFVALFIWIIVVNIMDIYKAIN